MWLFWAAAAVLAAAAGGLVALRAMRAAKHSAAGADPSLDVYRRHLTDLDDLAARGLLGEEEHRAARTEGARRLLSAADRKGGAETAGGRTARWITIGGAAAAGALALALYLVIGSPGTPDQPYRARVAAWRKADPNKLDAAQMAAVLASLAAERPNDWRVFDYLGRAQLAAGDPFAAAHSLQHASQLAPQEPGPASILGVALLGQADGKTSPEALAAFRRAVALDPNDPVARYYLARGKIEAGDVAGGLADWRALAASLPPGDARRTVEAAIDQTASAGQAVAAAPAVPEDAAGQAAFIRGMVESLAARLKSQPDDPAGWARLVRSYGVLGDRDAQARALAEARARFANRPEALATIEAGAKAQASPPQ